MVTSNSLLSHLAHLTALHQPLIGDYDYCQHHLDGDNPHFWRRALVRTVAALAEGMASAMKQCALENLPVTDFDKRQALAGETYRVSKHGTVEKHRFRTPPLENICFAFRSYAEFFGCDYPLDTQSAGWAALVTTFAIRHRVMHPSRAADLDINPDEVRIIQTAFCYVINSMSLLQAAGVAKLADSRRT